MVDNFQGGYTRDELVLVGYDAPDAFFNARYNYYNCYGTPTICGDGLSDVWPCTQATLTADYNAHNAQPSPLRISLRENGVGDFTAHIVAEQTVTNAYLVMVAVEDDYVPGYGGSTSHLPYHARTFLTAVLGDAFSLSAGNSTDINKTFTVDPEWRYEEMGVACWVQKNGGTNPSPSPDIPTKRQVLQAAYRGTGGISADAGVAGGQLTLSWQAIPGVAEYWVYGAANEPFFTPGFSPGYAYRVDIVPAGTTDWSSPNGVGDPNSNLTYLIVGVDVAEWEVGRSDRSGEFDFEAPR